MAFRLQALGRRNGSRVDGVEAERIFIAPSLAYKCRRHKNNTVTSYQKDDLTSRTSSSYQWKER
ncbi:hypothetical protein O9929_16715 [Vibrio lentus]|nr:hypothetical protein [Vibrio lentus]